MKKCSIFSVGASLPSVEKEVEKVIEKKFFLEPVFEGTVPPDRRGMRGSQLLADIQLDNILRLKPEYALFSVGITPYDLYSDRLNFVFGVAYPFKGCIVSYARLFSEDERIFLSRLRKEITHEMGHVFGLKHCPNPRCVMHFSNSLEDTDYKSEDFCQTCSKKLRFIMEELGIFE